MEIEHNMIVILPPHKMHKSENSCSEENCFDEILLGWKQRKDKRFRESHFEFH